MYVQDLVTGLKIEGATIELYVGGYSSSCSSMTKKSPLFVHNTTDSTGTAIIHNLNFGMTFTALVKYPST